jgi:TPP-dependent pyruvate/acetoin dehydrogenase alpha subunit
VRAVYAATKGLVERARRGEGPAFLVCNTYRYHGHHVGDVDRAYYRSKDEEELWRSERDPIVRLGSWLLEAGLADDGRLKQLEDEVRTEVEAGVQFALEAPFPEPSEATEDVYA